MSSAMFCSANLFLCRYTKISWLPGLPGTHWGNYSAPPDPIVDKFLLSNPATLKLRLRCLHVHLSSCPISVAYFGDCTISNSMQSLM